MEKESTINVNSISKKFGSRLVLDHVTLQCGKGEIVGIIGRNGCGKTVLLKCICGLLRQDSGEIYIDGKRNNEYFREGKKLGILIETPSFLEHYTGIVNLEMLYGIQQAVSREKIISYMKYLGLDPDLKIPVSKYSLGMKQKLAIVQAVMEEQEIILLDEPTNGLDLESVTVLRRFLLELKERGRTILLASHSKEDVDRLCDRLYRMENGKLYSTESTIH